jgi:hypothetical protein
VTATLRALALPVLALVLVGGVLGVQLARGGGSFEPLRPADPCAARTVTSQSEGIEGLTEQLVLIGLDDAACSLGVSREALTLDLAAGGDRSAAEVDALHDGLQSAIQRLDAAGALPPASELVDEALDTADLNGLLEALIRAVPDAVVDGALKTDDVLTRAVDELDLRALLADLDDPDELDAQVRAAVIVAVREALVARVRGLV